MDRSECPAPGAWDRHRRIRGQYRAGRGRDRCRLHLAVGHGHAAVDRGVRERRSRAELGRARAPGPAGCWAVRASAGWHIPNAVRGDRHRSLPLRIVSGTQPLIARASLDGQAHGYAAAPGLPSWVVNAEIEMDQPQAILHLLAVYFRPTRKRVARVAVLDEPIGTHLTDTPVQAHPAAERDLEQHLVAARVQDRVVESTRSRDLPVVVNRAPHAVGRHAHHKALVVEPEMVGRDLIALLHVAKADLSGPVDDR